MHSYIVHGSSQPKREKNIIVLLNKLTGNLFTTLDSFSTGNFPDILTVGSEKSIGIAQIRQLKQNLMVKPIQKGSRVVIIREAQALTVEAQNALLKTLEEPSPDTHLILELENPHLLLKTIISRCLLVSVKPQTESKTHDSAKIFKFLNKLSQASPGEQIVQLKTITKNKNPHDILLQSLLALKHALPENPYLYTKVKVTQAALQSLNSNCNQKLVLEQWLFELAEEKQN